MRPRIAAHPSSRQMVALRIDARHRPAGPPRWWCEDCHAPAALVAAEDGRACADCGGRELTMLVRP